MIFNDQKTNKTKNKNKNKQTESAPKISSRIQ
jgi:hypothetical protein